MGLALAAMPPLAPTAPPDDARNAWQARREAHPATGAAGLTLGALTLPPEAAAAAQRGLGDLRLLAPGGAEMPYVIDRRDGGAMTRRWEGRLIDRRREEKTLSAWTIDLSEPRTFDAIALRVEATDFAKRLLVEASDDGSTWRTLLPDAGIFDGLWGFRVHHTQVTLPKAETARYLRLTANDRKSPPVEVRGGAVEISDTLAGERWTRPAPLTEPREEKGESRWRIGIPGGLPLDKLTLQAEDPVFSRRVRIEQERSEGGRKQFIRLGGGEIYRLRTDAEPAPAAEALEIGATPPQGDGPLWLVIENGDSAPLRLTTATCSGTAMRLIFTLPRGEAAPLYLYYGNPVTRAPHYDLAALQGRLRQAERLAHYAAGPEVKNPKYQAAPPLSFLAAAGAELDTAGWKMQRMLTAPEREDIYAIALTPADLSLLREDLADVRLVNAAGKQVPYLLQQSQEEQLLALRIEPARASRDRGRNVSLYQLEPAERLQGNYGAPLTRLQITVAEPFFSRMASVGLRREDEERDARPVFSGELARRAAAGEGPVSIDLPGEPARSLTLEIHEGDNAPLTITQAEAAAPVWRVVFKMKPEPGAACRLLLGNARALAPRYDIETLRREVLAYNAIPAAAGALTANPDYSRRVSEWTGDLPAKAWIWGALLLAVAALLMLTFRLLGKPHE